MLSHESRTRLFDFSAPTGSVLLNKNKAGALHKFK